MTIWINITILFISENKGDLVLFICAGVAILFALSWLPLSIFSLTVDILYSGESFPHVTSQNLYMILAICHVTAMSSAVSNPVVYGWLNSNIRQEFLQLLPSKCGTPTAARGPSVGDEGTTRTALPTIIPRRDSVTMLLQNGDQRVVPSSFPQTLVTAL